MREIRNGDGLCMTCNNAPSCFHRARRGSALFCETFDDYVHPDVRIGGRMTFASADRFAPVRAAEEDAATYAGLCMNCDHRRTCGHPKPAGGVWHCENYA